MNPFAGPLFDNQPFTLQFTAAVDSGRFSSQDIHFRQAKTDLVAELDVLLAERPVINSKLRSTLLDLTPLQQHLLATRAAQPAAKAPAQKLLFTDQVINLVGDVPFDLTLDLAVDEFLFGPNQFRKVSFMLELLPQSLRLQEFEFRGVRDGHYAGSFSAERQADGTALKLTGRAADLKLGLIGVSGQDPDSLPPSDILLDLTGKGSTWRELAQTLTGSTRWYTGSGRVSNAGLDLLFSDLMSQIFSTLNPLSKKSQFTQLNCAVYAADFLNGQAKLAPIVIQTDQITAFSEGKVDLSSEAVDMSFRTVPRKGLGISAGAVVNPFFRIGGTLMKPALQLDVTKGAISGGAMVATAGLSVLFKSLS
ncbi:MAG TPA: AsmA-like C-terminal region-containing protein, partial [Xanthomonadales bacterium]|nr:AsmA-like C-terminal region-containing protein [Xanthomonadales bacterium]